MRSTDSVLVCHVGLMLRSVLSGSKTVQGCIHKHMFVSYQNI